VRDDLGGLAHQTSEGDEREAAEDEGVGAGEEEVRRDRRRKGGEEQNEKDSVGGEEALLQCGVRWQATADVSKILTPGPLANDEAALKLLYLAIKNAKKTWGRGHRDWLTERRQLNIHFEGRLPDAP
jgi:hypothetical protein